MVHLLHSWKVGIPYEQTRKVHSNTFTSFRIAHSQLGGNTSKWERWPRGVTKALYKLRTPPSEDGTNAPLVP